MAESFADGVPVQVHTRPEDIEIFPAGELLQNQITATVEQVAYLGERFEYHVQSGGVSFVLAAPKKQRYGVGDAVRLALDPDRLNIRSR
jgi:ABC-type Fe3+/spermidine/putrescine transport system ATPase subunit